jgi:hypothetical protein
MDRIADKTEELTSVGRILYPYPTDLYSISSCCGCFWRLCPGSDLVTFDACDYCLGAVAKYINIRFTLSELLTFSEGYEDFICVGCGDTSLVSFYGGNDIALCSNCFEWARYMRESYPMYLLLTRALPLLPELAAEIMGLMLATPHYFFGGKNEKRALFLNV